MVIAESDVERRREETRPIHRREQETESPMADSIDDFVLGQQLANTAETLRLRSLSMEERGRMIDAACRTAADLATSRRVAGFPELVPAPWPRSTLEFLARHARDAQSGNTV